MDKFEPKPQMAELDLARFVAALMVCVFHIGFAVWADPASGLGPYHASSYTFPELRIFWFGWVGVEVFFVISGLVIFASAERSTPIQFAGKRMVRLYPAVWICATITLIVCLIAGIHADGTLTERYINSTLLLPQYPYIEGVYWTLQIEITFYAVIFTMIALGLSDKIIITAHFLVIISSSYLFLKSAGLIQLPTRIARMTLVQHGAYFALGMYIYELARCRESRLVWTGFALGLLATTIGVLDHAQEAIEGSVLRSQPMTWMLIPLPIIVWAFGVVACIVGASRRTHVSDKLGRSLRLLGLASYPLYLVHFTLGVAITKNLVETGLPKGIALVVALCCVIALSILIAERAEPWLRDRMVRAFSAASRKVRVLLSPV